MKQQESFQVALKKWRTRLLLPIAVVGSIILLLAYETTENSLSLVLTNQMSLVFGLLIGVHTSILAMNTTLGTSEPSTQRKHIFVSMFLALLLFSFWAYVFWRP